MQCVDALEMQQERNSDNGGEYRDPILISR
jgi:hypothetical protein